MYASIGDLIFLLMLFILLFIVYRRITYQTDLFSPIKQGYGELERKLRVSGYTAKVSKKPQDSQKIIFKEFLILSIVIFVMFILAAKLVFFTAVVSGSMKPTFDRYDLVLIQNIDHRYRPGDIIMFRSPETGKPYTHRIYSIVDGEIFTKGDAGGRIDPWKLKKEDILGKAVLIQGKPIVIKEYGRFFIVETKDQEMGPFGQDYRKYMLFFQVVKLYGYIIAVASLMLYIILTARQKPWQSR